MGGQQLAAHVGVEAGGVVWGIPIAGAGSDDDDQGGRRAADQHFKAQLVEGQRLPSMQAVSDRSCEAMCSQDGY